jgi:uncharacterized membrane protein
MRADENLLNERERDRDWLSGLLLCLIVLLGAGLRVYDLGAESYWIDEIIMLRVAGGSLSDVLAAAQAGRPPVYVVLAHFWLKLFGVSEAATRSLSALAGIASIPIMYAVGRELFGRRVGLTSALLMAISQFHIYYSQDYRYYSWFTLLTLCSFLLCRRALDGERRRDFVAYALASILLFYTHTFGVFVLAAQNLYFVLRWGRDRRPATSWFVAQAFILLAVSPGLFIALRKVVTGTSGAMQWIPDPALWKPLTTLLAFIGAGLDYPAWPTVVAGTSFLVIGTLLFAVRRGTDDWLASARNLVGVVRDVSAKQDQLLFVACWLLCPIVIPFVLSKVVGPMYISRYTISASPAFYLLLALGLSAVRKVVPVFISLGAIVILIAPGLRTYYVSDVKEQWREAAAYVEQHSQPNDVLVYLDTKNNARRDAFYRYYRGDLRACGLDAELDQEATIAAALATCISSSDRVWLVWRNEPGRSNRMGKFLLNPTGGIMRLISEQKLRDISVYLFAVIRR